MPYETGGRADKLGNRYEGRWIVKQLLRLINEEIASITVEAIGGEEEGVDLWIKNLDGSRECHQCKARNASKEYWDLSDMAARGIFEKAKKQLDFNKEVTFYLISSVAGVMINDLTIRGRNSNCNSEDFYKYQIENSGNEVKKAFKNFVRYMELNVDTIPGRSQGYEYLKRIHLIQYADDTNVKDSLKQTIKSLYNGDAESIYSLISNYAIENDLLGREISSYMLNNYLQTQPNISSRQLHKDGRIIPRFECLNNEFVSSFVPINNSIIHRSESESFFKEILSGTSIIMHGKAGSGKSGCILELLNQLKKDDIIHLALKLDRRTPEYTSEKYGESLGLPASPVFCLNAVSKDREAVLILDQLDAIRWTNNHSRTALEVCKEMIREVSNINVNRDKKIILVFVCRTFDFENDRGIKLLFSNNVEKNEHILWKEIVIGEMSDDNVKAIVGDAYNSLSIRLQVLLRTPNNLYIWTNLEEKSRSNAYITSSDLIKQWWEQLRYNCEMIGTSNIQLNELKDAIVNNIDKIGKLMIPEHMLSSYSKLAIEQLRSNGLLLLHGKSIGFVHQSFYDYFSVEKMLNQVYDGISVIDIIGPKMKQTPTKRYQIQMLFQNLLDYDMNKLISIGRELLQNDEIRFYMKYVFLEVLGQAEAINQCAELFLKEYLNISYWKNHIMDVVFISHPTFIKFLIHEGYIPMWLKSEQDRDIGFMLLRSVDTAIPDEITTHLYPLAFKDAETDNKIFSTLCWNIEDDSDNMFEFRLEIMKKRPQLRNTYVHWEAILNVKPDRAIRMLDMLVKNKDNKDNHSRHDLDQKVMDKFIEAAKDKPLYIWNTFMPYLADSTLNITNIYDKGLEFWESNRHMDQIFGRTYIKMIKASAQALIQENPEEFLVLCEPYYHNYSLIVNEILLYIMEMLPNRYSDYALNWLMEKPYQRLFNYTDENDEYLYSAKKIIEKHSKTCSDEVFWELEKEIYYFHEEDELRDAKYRFDYNNENRKAENRLLVYWPYWGKAQHYLMPALDCNRISKKASELIVLLQRRFDNLDVTHKRSRVTGGCVGSTIGSRADKISDKQWLRIIENRKTYKHRRERWPRGEGAILESSPGQFARDLERIGEKDPNRVARLALNFSDEVDSHYASAVYHIIGQKKAKNENPEKDNWEPVSVDVAQQLFLKFSSRDDVNVAMSFCRALRNRADENWSDEILSIVSNIANNHANPEEGKMNVWSSEDKEGKTVEMLHSNSMNCVRGCAAEAIAALLWDNQDRYCNFKDAVEAVVNDKHLAVNMAAIECISPIMNIDREMATNWFFDLAKKDIRIVAHPYAYNLFYYLFEDNEESIKKTVIQMYQSEYEDVSEVGARHVANMNLLYGCFEDIVFQEKKKTKAQKQGTLEVAIDLLKHQKFHDKCKMIIELFLTDEENFSNSYYRILNNGSVSVEKDLEFIVKIVTAKANRLIMHRFVDFINENDHPIEGFKDIIFGMCQNIVQNTQGEANDIRSELYGIAPELSILIALLYDRTQGNFEVNQQCLDMWDMMFENRIGTVRELSRSIMNC